VPIKFDTTFTDEVLVPRAGLALVGRLLSRTDLHERFDALTVACAAHPIIGHGGVALSMAGLLCLARGSLAAMVRPDVLGVGHGRGPT